MSSNSTMGRDTPKYRAVLRNFPPLAKAIEVTPETSENLQRNFIDRSWLSPKAQKINADGLVTLALNRIETSISDYDVLMNMLGSLTGMDEIARKISKGIVLLYILLPNYKLLFSHTEQHSRGREHP